MLVCVCRPVTVVESTVNTVWRRLSTLKCTGEVNLEELRPVSSQLFCSDIIQMLMVVSRSNSWPRRPLRTPGGTAPMVRIRKLSENAEISQREHVGAFHDDRSIISLNILDCGYVCQIKTVSFRFWLNIYRASVSFHNCCVCRLSFVCRVHSFCPSLIEILISVAFSFSSFYRVIFPSMQLPSTGEGFMFGVVYQVFLKL